MSEERATYGTGRKPVDLPAEVLLEYSDPNYRPPNGDEIREATRIAGLPASQAAQLLGVTTARTIRKWIGGERDIPYSAWRLLLIYAGLVSAPSKEDSPAGLVLNDNGK